MRAIEPLADLAGPASLGPVPELRWLPIAELVVDESYQRPLIGAGLANIRRIARGFSWLKFAPVVVSPVAGGKYAVVDGQHRATAAASIGIDAAPCLVIQADGPQQAGAFSALNNNVVRMNRLQLYHAALAAGEGYAVEVAAVAREAGATIVRHACASHQLKPGETMAYGTIQTLIAKRGRKFAVRVLRGCLATRRAHASPLVAKVIFALANVLADHHEWLALSDEKLHGALSGLEILDALDNATIEAASRKGCKVTDLLEAALVTHLDRALSKRAVA